MANNENSVNGRIAAFRKLAGFTQEEAANKLGMKRNTYARMEKYGNPSPEMLKKIADLYNISVNSLIYNFDVPDNKHSSLLFNDSATDFAGPITTAENNVLMALRMLPDEKKQKVIDLVSELFKETMNK